FHSRINTRLCLSTANSTRRFSRGLTGATRSTTLRSEILQRGGREVVRRHDIGEREERAARRIALAARPLAELFQRQVQKSRQLLHAACHLDGAAQHAAVYGGFGSIHGLPLLWMDCRKPARR